jgi:hypothetical protein
MSGLSLADTAGIEFTARIWQVTGLTAAQYYKTLRTIISGALVEAKWAYHRMGGAGSGYFKIQGGVVDLDDAVKNEWEMEIVRGSGALGTSGIWYRGRIVRYRISLDKNQNRITEIWTEGYASKLAEIYFSQTIAAGQTVRQAVQSILTTNVTGNARIRFDAANDLVGAYTLVGSLVFKNVPVLSAIHKLAMLQGSTEWGVTEGGSSATAAPAFYFKGESTATSETAVFIMQRASDVEEMTTEGNFQGAYNRVTVVGGFSGGTIVTATANDTTAQDTYGIRAYRVNWAALQDSTDASRLASNYVTYFKDGNGSYAACKSNPTERLEPDRTNNGYGSGSPAIPVSPKAQWWGDSSKLTEHWSVLEYNYKQGCPFVFSVCGRGGAVVDDMTQLVARMSDQLDTYSNEFEGMSPISGGGGIDGSGSANTLAKFTAATTISNSLVTDDGTDVKINQANLAQVVQRTMFVQTADQNFNNTTTETTIFGTGVGTLTIPTDFFAAGRSLRIVLSGRFGTTGTPTFNTQFKFGSTAYLSTGASPMLGNVTNGYFQAEVLLTCRTAGATGTFEGTLRMTWYGGSAGDRHHFDAVWSGTVDTTGENVIDVTGTWGTANASNTITSHVAFVEVRG